MIIRRVATVVPAEGVILERVLDATHPLSNGGLSRHAYGTLDAAQKRTGWGRGHRRRFALDSGDVLASATQYDLAAILDQRPVRVCGIGSIFSEPAPRRTGHAEELVERLLDQAARHGAVMALRFSEGSQDSFS
jgi:GNAT superfamily N-acetyltransferase